MVTSHLASEIQADAESPRPLAFASLGASTARVLGRAKSEWGRAKSE